MRTDLLDSIAVHRPNYFNERLKRFHRPYYEDIRFRHHASVNLSRVVGMSHCEYANLTWAELVGDSAAARPPGLKRLDVCLRELSANPSYYLSRHLKKDWHFFEVGEDYFVTNGHHRSVVGRLFLELNELSSVVHGVHVMEVDPADWARAQHEWEKGGPPERWTAPGNAGDSFEHGVDGERV